MDFTGPILGIESGNDPYAKNPRSSASGPGQFIDSTWLSMIHKYRPDLEQGRSKGEILGLRSGPENAPLSAEMTQHYADENQAYLASKGLPTTPGAIYLGHFLGPGGAAKVLGASPDASAGSLLGDSVVAANPFIRGMTAGQMLQWAEGKMQAQPLPPATGVGSAPPIGAPAPTNPDTQSPVPAAAPTQAQQLQGAGGGGGSLQPQPVSSPQMQWLQMAKGYRPQINYQQLAQLRFPAGFKPPAFLGI